jgi:drug/metabolite transporter (DMT)-like permease
MPSSSKQSSSERRPLPRETVGRIEILLSAVGYGFIGIFGKQAYDAGLAPGELLTLRFSIAALVLWTYVFAARRELLRLRPRTIAACAALGVGGYALFTTLYFQALRGLSASLSALLLYTFPVIVTVAARVLFKEEIGWRRSVALPVVAAGLVMLLWGETRVTNWSYVALGLGSAVFYSAYILASSRALRGVNGLAAGLVITTAAALALAIVDTPSVETVRSLDAAAWSSVVGLAVVSTVGPVILFLRGLEKLTNAEVSILSLLEPITAVVASAILLGERLSPVQLAGGAIILAALAFSSLRPSAPRAPASGSGR